MNQTNLTRFSTFGDILDELERLSRQHLLSYRVQVGALLLAQFWDDDPAAFSSRDPGKEVRFNTFFIEHGEDLRRYGLSQRQARNSVRASIVMRTLPVEIREQLFVTQLIELTRLADPTQRARVAQTAVQQNWTVIQLRDAVSAVRAGLPIDADEETPGVQVAAPEETIRRPVPGRLVTRAEKLAEQVDTWSRQWQQADTTRLRPVQRRRLAAAADALEARVVELRKLLRTEAE